MLIAALMFARLAVVEVVIPHVEPVVPHVEAPVEPHVTVPHETTPIEPHETTPVPSYPWWLFWQHHPRDCDQNKPNDKNCLQ